MWLFQSPNKPLNRLQCGLLWYKCACEVIFLGANCKFISDFYCINSWHKLEQILLWPCYFFQEGEQFSPWRPHGRRGRWRQWLCGRGRAHSHPGRTGRPIHRSWRSQECQVDHHQPGCRKNVIEIDSFGFGYRVTLMIVYLGWPAIRFGMFHRVAYLWS